MPSTPPKFCGGNQSIRSRISAGGLNDFVTLDTVYYTDHECLERLADADLVVFLISKRRNPPALQ